VGPGARTGFTGVSLPPSLTSCQTPPSTCLYPSSFSLHQQLLIPVCIFCLPVSFRMLRCNLLYLLFACIFCLPVPLVCLTATMNPHPPLIPVTYLPFPPLIYTVKPKP
jgi:hypothetical protein